MDATIEISSDNAAFEGNRQCARLMGREYKIKAHGCPFMAPTLGIRPMGDEGVLAHTVRIPCNDFIAALSVQPVTHQPGE